MAELETRSENQDVRLVMLACKAFYTYANGKKEVEEYEMPKSKVIEDIESLKQQGLKFEVVTWHLDGSVSGENMQLGNKLNNPKKLVRVDFQSERKEVDNG